MFRALLVTEAPLDPSELRADLEAAGIALVAETLDAASLAQSAMREAADLVVAASTCPSPALFEGARMLGMLAPCPFVLFTSDSDAAQIEWASNAGIHAYVVDGYAKHRLLSIVQVAQARFRHEQQLKDQLLGLSQRFEERKLVDRAKGVLMRSRGITEDEAFELLRSLAMRARQRIGVVAQSVIDMSRAGEAVNRAGQLRMLSQRIVLRYAQALNGFETQRANEAIDEGIHRVESNLGMLRKAISTRGYGDLVERVATSWHAVERICAEAPEPMQLEALDACAETMLADAESLTEFLDASGLAASLHVINVAGRQRMLGQRIAKLCFMLALAISPPRVAQLRTLTQTFQAALDHLRTLPLTSEAIAGSLQTVELEWQRLARSLVSISAPNALAEVADASERLLEASEQLTDQYERAMQMLIGDRLGKLR